MGPPARNPPPPSSPALSLISHPLPPRSDHLSQLPHSFDTVLFHKIHNSYKPLLSCSLLTLVNPVVCPLSLHTIIPLFLSPVTITRRNRNPYSLVSPCNERTLPLFLMPRGWIEVVKSTRGDALHQVTWPCLNAQFFLNKDTNHVALKEPSILSLPRHLTSFRFPTHQSTFISYYFFCLLTLCTEFASQRWSLTPRHPDYTSSRQLELSLTAYIWFLTVDIQAPISFFRF